MPYTGYDPGGPIGTDIGSDPSRYYSMSAGGRFPGDIQNYFEYLAAQSRGTAGGNPDYDVPDWATKWGKLGRALGWHERNVQNGGEGQAPSAPGGYPYHFFSGPGASYGPAGGPLHGLVDQGRPGAPWDGMDRPEGGSVPGKDKGRKGGGGGGGKINLQPYQGLNHQSSFVGWQPTQAFGGSTGPTEFVRGAGSSMTGPAQAPPFPGGGGGQGGGGKGRGGGAGGGKGKGGKGGGKGAGGKGGANPSDSDILAGFLSDLVANRGVPGKYSVGQWTRPQIGGGVNTNNIDMGTPGWMKDGTSGVHNTSGMPGPTAFGPNPGESFDSYLTRLHDSGFDSGSMGTLAGGFKQDEAGNWDWAGWGAGPVLRTDEGYQFANQANPAGNVTLNKTGGPEPGGKGGGMFGIGSGPGGGGGGAPMAADYITGGIFSVPAV